MPDAARPAGHHQALLDRLEPGAPGKRVGRVAFRHDRSAPLISQVSMAEGGQAGWRVERKASSSVLVGRPAREPNRVHLSAATAVATRALSAGDRPSATIKAKAP